MGKKRRYFDYSLLTIVIFLVGFGLVMLYSTSSYSAQIDYGNSMYYVIRQALFSIIGFGLMLLIAKFDYHYFSKFAWLAYIVAFVMMALVQTPLGKEVNGAKRWEQ